MTNNLKDRIRGGLDELLQPTIKHDDESIDVPQQKKKEIIKRCNFLIEKSYHTRLKKIAADENCSMVNELKKALDLYFKTKETK